MTRSHVAHPTPHRRHLHFSRRWPRLLCAAAIAALAVAAAPQLGPRLALDADGSAPSVAARPAGQAAPLATPTARPFRIPFDTPPGPDTWLMAQAYGNTTGAYRQRNTTYAAGQGIHFGTDFTARCGTPLVSMADGVVFAVDVLSFGSAPHNLMIDHPELGYATFYGHLLERPNLSVGQRVSEGDPIAFTGDPADTCNGRPHLHLEIRDLRHYRKYNPALLVEADWQALSLIGSFSRAYQRDLDEPRKWQHVDDQPESVIGGPLLNNFARPWPPDTP